jgi:galactoside O-acetyltransferase
MSQISQLIEWLICSAPTTKLCSDIRYHFYRRKLRSEQGVFWSGNGFTIQVPENVSIGKKCSFGRNVFLGAAGGKFGGENSFIVIGDGCQLCQNVILLTGGHDWTQKVVADSIRADIILEDNVILFPNSIVLPGVTIGNNTLIGAGSVVTKSIPADVIAVGNPCRPIKKRE